MNYQIKDVEKLGKFQSVKFDIIKANFCIIHIPGILNL